MTEMGKKQREDKARIARVQARPTLAPVTINRAADGEHFVLGLTGHTVRVKTPSGAESAARNARRALTDVVKKMQQDGYKPLPTDFTEIIKGFMAAEKALIGLSLMEKVLTAREKEPQAKIHTLADPTQALINTFLAKGGKVDDEESRAKDRSDAAAAKLMTEFGLDVSEFVGKI